MIFQPLYRAVLLLGLAVAALPAWSAEPLPSLRIQGDFYDNACEPAPLARLRLAVFDATAGNQPEEAWRLVETLVCGTGQKAERLVLRSAAKKIRVRRAETGSSAVTSTREAPDAALMARQRAWRPELTAAPSGTQIELSYASNQACARSVMLRHKSTGWQIVERSEACE